jgi:hypothetical protein
MRLNVMCNDEALADLKSPTGRNFAGFCDSG